MKILIAPLNWGLGHASRCVPLVRRYIAAGDEVVFGGDGASLVLLKQHFPTLRTIELAPLHLQYSSGNSQVLAMLSQIPRLLVYILRDHRRIEEVVDRERFDMVLSDNRFGLWTKQTRCVYITHQLHIALPRGWQWLEGVAQRAHAYIYKRYSEVWVPDYQESDSSFSGTLGHVDGVSNVHYIGPLSRFDIYREVVPNEQYDVVAVLSGLEPQRTLFEQQIAERYRGSKQQVLIVRGKVEDSNMTMTRGNIVRVNRMDDRDLASCLLGAKRIIARSGYSTIMDLAALDVLEKAELTATPGQPEQEYLERLIRSSYLSSAPDT